MTIEENLREIPKGARLFLAEGPSEVHFLAQCLRVLGCEQDAVIHCIKGLGRLGTVLKALAQTPGFDALRCLGVMVDAETDHAARANSLMDHFQKVGLALDRAAIAQSAVCCTHPCPVGVFISPGAGRAGRIETLARAEITGHLAWPCIAPIEDCIEHAVNRRPGDKQVVQMFIAALKDGLSNVGDAFREGVLNAGHPAYEQPRALFAQLLAAAG